MGGTFDPVHHGHLSAASEVSARFALDEVVFVPTGTPWQKADREVSPAEDRYLMTVIATASNPRFSVSRTARTPWRRSWAGAPRTSCSRSPTSSASAGPATSRSTWPPSRTAR